MNASPLTGWMSNKLPSAYNWSAARGNQNGSMRRVKTNQGQREGENNRDAASRWCLLGFFTAHLCQRFGNWAPRRGGLKLPQPGLMCHAGIFPSSFTLQMSSDWLASPHPFLTPGRQSTALVIPQVTSELVVFHNQTQGNGSLLPSWATCGSSDHPHLFYVVLWSD